MNEINNEIDPTKLMIRRPHRLRKPLHVKSQTRKLYEDQNPGISVRVALPTKLAFLYDAKRLNMTERDYITSMIEKSRLNLENIIRTARDEGIAIGDAQGYKRGLLEGAHTTQNTNVNYEDALRDVLQRYSIYIRCRRCQGPIHIRRDSYLHRELMFILEPKNYVCTRCELALITERNLPPPVPPRPSWLPMDQKW